MRLKELSERTGVSVATIKYYLREGLLAPGRTINATLAEYDHRHVDRLRLIVALRVIIGAPIGEIATLIARIDDPDEDLFEILGHAQLLGLGLSDDVGAEPAQITTLVEQRGWTTAVEVRRALAAQLRTMNELGIEVSDATLTRYADAADAVAQLDLASVVEAASRDEAVLRTAVGVHSYTTLLTRMVAVAQAAHAQRSDADGLFVAQGGHEMGTDDLGQ